MTSTEAASLNRRVKPTGCMECPACELHGGFVPDEGDPATAVVAEIAEAAGADEMALSRPLIGPTGRLDEALWNELGIGRAQRLLCNTLRCRPPGNVYPVGKIRAAAERACRQYDDKLRSFRGGARICTYHPAALFRQPNLLKFVRRAYQFAWTQLRPQVLLGGKARGVFWPGLKGGEKKWQRHFDGVYPRVQRAAERAAVYFIVGLDLEYSGRHPTVLGIGYPDGRCWSIPWDEERCRQEIDQAGLLVGHFFLTADLQVLAQEGIVVDPGRVVDTAVLHYLCNAELCKDAPKDDRESAKGQGYMDLWSMASLYTDLPNWKECRGRGCAGPCPKHDVFGYNGLDALAPVLALPALQADIKAKGIPDALVRHVSETMLFCAEMSRKGVLIDRAHLKALSMGADAKRIALFPRHTERKPRGIKDHVVYDAPFNPSSPKQVREYFAERRIPLDASDLESIEAAAKRHDDPWLQRLREYKQLGKDPAAWFTGFDGEGRIHPRFNALGTSSGRLSSSNPNFQNVKRGELRRAVIAPPGHDLQIADYSQLELRMCLYAAGQTEALGGDAFKWLVEHSDGAFERIAEANRATHPKWSARDWAKSVSHAADYLEGIVLVNTRTQSAAEREGALIVHRDWEFFDGWVGFTGVNLAARLFGGTGRGFAERKAALQIQEAYFARFPILRRWHHRITAQAQEGWIQSGSGRYLTLGTLPGLETKYASEVAKQAAAFIGQGQSADYVQENMLNFKEHMPNLQVHDELVFEVPEGWDTKRALDFVRPMVMESRFYPGFSCPIKAKRGKNWLDGQEIGVVA